MRRFQLPQPFRLQSQLLPLQPLQLVQQLLRHLERFSGSPDELGSLLLVGTGRLMDGGQLPLLGRDLVFQPFDAGSATFQGILQLCYRFITHGLEPILIRNHLKPAFRADGYPLYGRFRLAQGRG